MTLIELANSGASLAFALTGVLYVAWVVRKSGADRKQEPARVRRVVENAPYARVHNIISRRR